MPLGLVSYGSSDSEDDSDNEPEKEIEKQEAPAPLVHEEKPEPVPTLEDGGEISDVDDIIPSVLDDEETTANIPGLSSSSSLFDSLPSISKATDVSSASKAFADENEDLSTIPKAKVYSEKPDLKALKPKKKGPVRIMAPSLTPR